jgi:hypothetical protein
MGTGCDAYGGRDMRTVFIEKQEGKRPFGGPSRRWQYNMNMDLK